MLRLIGAGLLALTLPAAALASAIVESLKGSAQVGGAPVRQGERIFTGASLATAPGAQARLRFDDGMEIVLGESSRLRLVDFRHTGGGPNDRVVLDLLAGSARVVTGGIARSNPTQFFLRTPQASFGVLGPTDFSVVVTEGSYVSVSRGTVIAANRAATVSLTPGPATAIASAGSTPEPRTLPPPVASSLTALGTVPVAPLDEIAPPAQAQARAETQAAPTSRPSDAPPPMTSAPRAPRLDRFVFAGASAGASNIDDAMTRGLITSGDVKSDSTGFKVFGGWQFHRYFGVEAAFVDLGEAKYDGTFNGTPITGGKLKVNGLNFSVVARLPLGERFALFAKGGAFVWEAEAKDTAAGVPFTSKTDGTGGSGGIGISYEITRNIELRTEAEIFGIGDGDKAALFSLGFALMF